MCAAALALGVLRWASRWGVEVGPVCLVQVLKIAWVSWVFVWAVVEGMATDAVGFSMKRDGLVLSCTYCGGSVFSAGGLGRYVSWVMVLMLQCFVDCEAREKNCRNV